MKTQLVLKDRIRKGGTLIERVVWAVPTPVNGCPHHFLGKDERQQPYLFITLEQLIILKTAVVGT